MVEGKKPSMWQNYLAFWNHIYLLDVSTTSLNNGCSQDLDSYDKCETNLTLGSFGGQFFQPLFVHSRRDARRSSLRIPQLRFGHVDAVQDGVHLEH